MLVNIFPKPFKVCLLSCFFGYIECCLDVDWIDDNTFATCGADKIINIMRIGTHEPLLTLEYASLATSNVMHDLTPTLQRSRE